MVEKRPQFLTAAFLLSISFNASAQITFQKTFGFNGGNEYGLSARQTSDGGYVIVGEASNDVCFIRTNPSGDTLWTRMMGGSAYDDALGVQITSDCGFVITGDTYSFGAGGDDVYLVRTDANGEVLWTRTFGGPNSDYGYSVQQTRDSGFVIVGDLFSAVDNATDVLLIRTNSSGELSWARTFGGNGYDDGNSVQQTSDGGYVITGRTLSFGAGTGDMYLIKTDSVGTAIWTRTFGVNGRDWGYSVQQTNDGGYIVAGRTNGGPGYGDVCLIKTDASGDTLWTKTFTGSYTGYDDDRGYCVQQTRDSGYIIAGVKDRDALRDIGDVYLIKTNALGDTLWTRAYGGANLDAAYSVQQTNDGGYIIAGYTSSFGTGAYDIYLIKTDSSGNVGCYERAASTRDTSSALLVTNPSTLVSLFTPSVSAPVANFHTGITATTLCATVGIPDDGRRVFRTFDLLQNYPNPFNPTTTIRFTLPTRTYVRLNIYDVLGQKVTTLVDGELSAGTHQREWDAGKFSGGVYFYRLAVGTSVETKKLIHLK